jgi:hypothetical protein
MILNWQYKWSQSQTILASQPNKPKKTAEERPAKLLVLTQDRKKTAEKPSQSPINAAKQHLPRCLKELKSYNSQPNCVKIERAWAWKAETEYEKKKKNWKGMWTQGTVSIHSPWVLMNMIFATWFRFFVNVNLTATIVQFASLNFYSVWREEFLCCGFLFLNFLYIIQKEKKRKEKGSIYIYIHGIIKF